MKKTRFVAVVITCELADQIGRIAVRKPAPPGPAGAWAAVGAGSVVVMRLPDEAEGFHVGCAGAGPAGARGSRARRHGGSGFR